jgi:ATP-dependent helicase YprA (DUF1998 family)
LHAVVSRPNGLNIAPSDVLFTSPTGSGKSLVFEVRPVLQCSCRYSGGSHWCDNRMSLRCS